MAIVKDTTGEIEEGSIYLPRSKKVPIGKPVVGVAIAVLKEELAEVYGDRFEVQEQGQQQEPENAEPMPEAEKEAEPATEQQSGFDALTRPPRRKSSTENKPPE